MMDRRSTLRLTLGLAAVALAGCASMTGRDPVQVPAFVAEESGNRDQTRTLVLDSDSAAHVAYTLVRGSGARLGDAEVAAAAGENTRLDKVVANLVAGSGADQADELGKFAVGYVLVRQGAPREVTRVLDATPGLKRLSQQNDSALWRVDQDVARVGSGGPDEGETTARLALGLGTDPLGAASRFPQPRPARINHTRQSPAGASWFGRAQKGQR